jgi:cobalt/nickel transport system permease protein
LKGEGFLTRNISSFTRTLEAALLTENLCLIPGLLQSLDARVKVVTFLLFIILIGLAHTVWILTAMLVLILALTLLSRLPTGYFLKRVIVFIPVFTALIAIPALFITPGEPLINLAGKVMITEQGARTAGLLVLRVTDSLSFGVLLILTTPWNGFLAALRWLRLPSLLVDILGMTYRYVFVLLHTTNSMFLARRSRTLGGFSGTDNRRWLTRILATILTKSQHLSEEVYMAMLARGYQGEIYTLNRLIMRPRDYIWVIFSLALAAVLLWSNNR